MTKHHLKKIKNTFSLLCLTMFMQGEDLRAFLLRKLINGSAGYRRIGYVVSAKPGLSYAKNKYSFNLSVPISAIRNRTQSYEDK